MADSILFKKLLNRIHWNISNILYNKLDKSITIEGLSSALKEMAKNKETLTP